MSGSRQKPLPFVFKGFNILMRFLIREHLGISAGFRGARVWMPLCAFSYLFNDSTKLIVEKNAGAARPACPPCPACPACPASHALPPMPALPCLPCLPYLFAVNASFLMLLHGATEREADKLGF